MFSNDSNALFFYYIQLTRIMMIYQAVLPSVHLRLESITLYTGCVVHFSYYRDDLEGEDFRRISLLRVAAVTLSTV